MRRSIAVALALLAFLPACSRKDPGGNANPPGAGSTPEEVFARARKALDARDWGTYWDCHEAETRFANVKDRRALFATLVRKLDEWTPKPAETWSLAIRPIFLVQGKFTEFRIQGLVAHSKIEMYPGFTVPFELRSRDGKWYLPVSR